MNKDDLSPPVKTLVHSVWSEAIGELSSLLRDPVERLKLEDIAKAEGILQAIRDVLGKDENSDETLGKYSKEFYSVVPHNEKYVKEINTKRVIAEKQDLCQVLFDWLRLPNKLCDWLSEQVKSVSKPIKRSDYYCRGKLSYDSRNWREVFPLFL